MTRLEAGAIEMKLDLADVDEIAGAALERAGSVLARHRIEVMIAPDLPMLRLDPILFEQVLFNLLDNAAKYAPLGSRIDLRARQDGMSSRLRSAMKGRASPPATSNGSSTSSIAFRRRIAAAPERAWAWRSAGGSSRPKVVASRHKTGGSIGRGSHDPLSGAGSDGNPRAGRSAWLMHTLCSS